jgi:uncharacterized protein (DUF1330 family)
MAYANYFALHPCLLPDVVAGVALRPSPHSTAGSVGGENIEVSSPLQEPAMPKAYSVVTYRSISDMNALAAYAEIAGPAIRGHGGRFIVRGMPAKTFEAGVMERVVVAEFDSVEQAVAAFESPAYAKALDKLGTAAVRDIRIVEGAE